MRMKHLTFVIILAAAVTGCATHYTIVPPAVDLTALGTIGLVTLKAENAKGDLDVAATQYFLQEVTAAQRVPVVELGPGRYGPGGYREEPRSTARPPWPSARSRASTLCSWARSR